jgi:hypothetical protein
MLGGAVAAAAGGDAGVNWTGSDFVVFGTMLALACGTYEVGTRMSRNATYRAGVGVAALAGFLLVWINLAVGIIGSELNRANLMFAGVLAVGVIGALIGRFQPIGMARALVATAGAQVSVAVVVLVAALGSNREVLGLTVCFTAMWLASAWLFRRAAREQGALR